MIDNALFKEVRGLLSIQCIKIGDIFFYVF